MGVFPKPPWLGAHWSPDPEWCPEFLLQPRGADTVISILQALQEVGCVARAQAMKWQGLEPSLRRSWRVTSSCSPPAKPLPWGKQQLGQRKKPTEEDQDPPPDDTWASKVRLIAHAPRPHPGHHGGPSAELTSTFGSLRVSFQCLRRGQDDKWLSLLKHRAGD